MDRCGDDKRESKQAGLGAQRRFGDTQPDPVGTARKRVSGGSLAVERQWDPLAQAGGQQVAKSHRDGPFILHGAAVVGMHGGQRGLPLCEADDAGFRA